MKRSKKGLKKIIWNQKWILNLSQKEEKEDDPRSMPTKVNLQRIS